MILKFFAVKSRYSCNKCPLLWQQIFNCASLSGCCCRAEGKSFSCTLLVSSYYFSIFLCPLHLITICYQFWVLQLFCDKKISTLKANRLATHNVPFKVYLFFVQAFNLLTRHLKRFKVSFLRMDFVLEKAKLAKLIQAP